MIQTLFGSLDEVQKPSFLDRMKEAVTRTRENLTERIDAVVSIGREIDRNTLDDLEATLLGADLGMTTTQEILEKLREKADRKQIDNVDELKRPDSSKRFNSRTIRLPSPESRSASTFSRSASGST